MAAWQQARSYSSRLWLGLVLCWVSVAGWHLWVPTFFPMPSMSNSPALDMTLRLVKAVDDLKGAGARAAECWS